MVIDVLRSKLGIEITASDISTAHRVGKKHPGKKRNLIVKLCRRDDVSKILKATKLQNRQAAGRIFVQESLTVLRGKIFYTLRKLKKDHPAIVKGYSVQNGSPVAYTPLDNSDRDKRHVIETWSKLQKFCSDFIKVPLQSAIENSIGATNVASSSQV